VVELVVEMLMLVLVDLVGGVVMPQKLLEQVILLL